MTNDSESCTSCIHGSTDWNQSVASAHRVVIVLALSDCAKHVLRRTRRRSECSSCSTSTRHDARTDTQTSAASTRCTDSSFGNPHGGGDCGWNGDACGVHWCGRFRRAYRDWSRLGGHEIDNVGRSTGGGIGFDCRWTIGSRRESNHSSSFEARCCREKAGKSQDLGNSTADCGNPQTYPQSAVVFTSVVVLQRVCMEYGT